MNFFQKTIFPKKFHWSGRMQFLPPCRKFFLHNPKKFLRLRISSEIFCPKCLSGQLEFTFVYADDKFLSKFQNFLDQNQDKQMNSFQNTVSPKIFHWTRRMKF